MNNSRLTPIQTKSALHKLKRKIPYAWDLNIYRGCQHGCCYCYAMYSHGYLGDRDFFQDIYVKINIVDELEKQLSAPDWQREVINIGLSKLNFQRSMMICECSIKQAAQVGNIRINCI